MPSNAFAGTGTLFQRSNMDSIPTFATIAEITDIDGPNMSRETDDTSSLDTTDGYRTFIGTFRDGGEVGLTMNFTEATYNTLMIDFEDDDPRDYQIVLPDTGATTFGFSGVVTKLGMKIPTGKKVSATVSIKVSGPVTLTT